MNGLYKALEKIAWVGQLGFSLMFPLLCFLGGCWWLDTRMGVGGWVYVPGLLLGLAVSAVTFWQFAQSWLREAGKDKRERPGGYNKH